MQYPLLTLQKGNYNKEIGTGKVLCISVTFVVFAFPEFFFPFSPISIFKDHLQWNKWNKLKPRTPTTVNHGNKHILCAQVIKCFTDVISFSLLKNLIKYLILLILC